MIPGEIIAVEGTLELNQGREKRQITVANSGDRPVQGGDDARGDAAVEAEG